VARRVSPTRPNGGPTPARRSRVDLIDRLFAEGRLTEPPPRSGGFGRRLAEASLPAPAGSMLRRGAAGSTTSIPLSG
jgi:hypothetical protein